VVPATQGGGAMKITDAATCGGRPRWSYCLDVETYMDWNDDGVGRLRGTRAPARPPRRNSA
jgi:hypothetical protein